MDIALMSVFEMIDHKNELRERFHFLDKIEWSDICFITFTSRLVSYNFYPQ